MNNDLINRSALLELIDKAFFETDPTGEEQLGFLTCRRMVREAPTIEAEPVRHGRWIMRGGYIRCSECDAKTLWKCDGGIGGFSHEYEQVRANYCPYCGAKMDGDAE